MTQTADFSRTNYCSLP